MTNSIRLLRPFLRGFPIIIITMILGFLAAKKYLSYTTPMFESTTKIKLADINEGVPGSNLFKDLDVFSSSNKISGEIELMKSSLLIGKALDSLDFGIEIYRVGDIKKKELYTQSPIEITPFWNYKNKSCKLTLTIQENDSFMLSSPSFQETHQGMLGDTISLLHGRIAVTKNAPFLSSRKETKLADNYEIHLLSNLELIEKVKQNVDITSTEQDVPVVRIIYKSSVPIKAARFANKLAETYVKDYIQSKLRVANTTVTFLDERIDNIATDLASSETAIERYKNQKGIINLRQETETDLRKIAQLKVQQTNLKMSLDAVKDLEAYIKYNGDRIEELAPNFQAYNDLLSTEIIKKIKLLQAERKDLLLTFTPQNAKVKVIDDKLKDLTSYLLESVTNTKLNLSRKYEDLTLDIQEAELSFVGLPNKEKNLNILTRDFNIYQNSYNFLNEKRIEAEIAQAAKIAFHRIISAASPSKNPVSPNRPIILIVSTLLACFISISIIYSIHAIKGKVNNTHNIEINSSTDVVLKTPFLKSEHLFEKTFLKSALELDMKGYMAKHSVIVYTSQTNRDGRQFHIDQLCKALTRQGKKIKMIRISETENLNSDELHISPKKILTLSKSEIQKIFQKASEENDLVLVDNEPLSKNQCGVLIMKFADVNHYVLDARRTALKHLLHIDLVSQEYNLPNFSYFLNRHQYNPNVVMICLKFFVKRFKSFRLKHKRKNYDV